MLREEFRHGSAYFIDHRYYDWTDVELTYFPPGDVVDRGPGAFHRDDAVFAPLRGDDGRVMGMFDVYDPSDGLVPSEETLQLFGVLATVTASAVEGARHKAELERLAITDGSPTSTTSVTSRRGWPMRSTAQRATTSCSPCS